MVLLNTLFQKSFSLHEKVVVLKILKFNLHSKNQKIKNLVFVTFDRGFSGRAYELVLVKVSIFGMNTRLEQFTKISIIALHREQQKLK